MSRSFRTNIDLGRNELQNAKIQNLAAAPATGASTAGQIYYDTTLGSLQYYNGTAWAAIGTVTPAATTVASSLTFGQAAAVGTGTSYARNDHVHGTPPAPTSSSVGAVANAGNASSLQTGTAAGRPAAAQIAGNIYVDNDDFLAFIATGATTFAQLAPFALTAAISPVSITGAQAGGTALTYARGDHAHAGPGFATVTTSAVGDTTAAGSATTASRSDHVHGRESFGATTTQTTFGAAATSGVATTDARSDHAHGTPVAPTATSVGAVANNGSAPGLQTGTAAGRPAAGQTVGNIYVDNDDSLLYIATGATTFSQLAAFSATAPAAVATAVVGVATSYARSDHAHGFTTGTSSNSAVTDAAATGTGTALALANHIHGREGFGTVTSQTVFGSAASTGTAATTSRSDHAHGTPTHVNTDHSAISLSALSAPTANIAFGGFRIVNLADPLAAQDAATKNYVDNAVVGLTWKSPVRLASTADLNGAYTATATVITGPANTALSTIDGVAPAVNDRILFKNAAAPANNGIYVVTSLGSAGSQYILTRATDSTTASQLVGEAVYVETGTAGTGNAGLVFNLNSPVTVTGFTVGTTAITYVAFSGASVATAGAGLVASGNVFNVVAGPGISVTADAVTVDRTTNGASVPFKYAQAFGDGAATTYTITHSLGSQDVSVTVYTNSGVFDEVECDVQHTNVNVVTLLFSVAPTANQFRVVVMG